ncbi:hypothetical protein [Desulforhabdus sp. TSK]|nr:hypothetical protein [Desulforhabdus sp. TSK]GKT10944.1 hypothetical protein DSTSK_42490 [Desulforhabdus sp. TSK]
MNTPPEVGPDVVSRIWPEFKRFSQVKQRLQPKSYSAFENELNHVKGVKS